LALKAPVRPLVISKEFRFEQIFGSEAAVDRNERIALGELPPMNSPSGEFLFPVPDSPYSKILASSGRLDYARAIAS